MSFSAAGREQVQHINFPEIVGSPFIVLEAPEAGGVPLPYGAEIPGLRTQPFVEQVQNIIAEISAAVTETLERTVTLMDVAEGTLGRVDRTVTAAETRIPDVLDAVSASVAATERLTARLESEVDSIAPSLRASIDSAAVVLGEASRVLGSAGQMVSTASPELEAILARLDSVTLSFDFFVARITEKPPRLITGVGKPPSGRDR